MALKIRLARGGAKKRPYYRIVIADSRSPRDGRFIDRIGSYNPLLPKDHADRVRIDPTKASEWLRKGARPTDRVARFLSQIHVKEMTAKEAFEIDRAKLREAGEEAAAEALPEPAEPDAKVLRAVEEGAGDAKALFTWKAGSNPNKGEPGEKAKQRVEERKEKAEARKAAEEEAKREAKEAAKAAKAAAEAPAEEPAPEAPAEEAPAEDDAAAEAAKED